MDIQQSFLKKHLVNWPYDDFLSLYYITCIVSLDTMNLPSHPSCQEESPLRPRVPLPPCLLSAPSTRKPLETWPHSVLFFHSLLTAPKALMTFPIPISSTSWTETTFLKVPVAIQEEHQVRQVSGYVSGAPSSQYSCPASCDPASLYFVSTSLAVPLPAPLLGILSLTSLSTLPFLQLTWAYGFNYYPVALSPERAGTRARQVRY